MVITLEPDIEAALKDLARKQGVAPEVLALNALRERFVAPALKVQPQDEWGRGLLAAASDCGVSLSNEAVSSEGLYE
jgi:predicted transcriptional regulator